MTASTAEINKIAAELSLHGHCFDGGSPRSAVVVATEWHSHGFGDSDVAEWAAVGCWHPPVAAELRDAELTPDAARKACEQLVEQTSKRGDDPMVVYIDGSPMYSACNGHIDADDIIAAAR